MSRTTRPAVALTAGLAALLLAGCSGGGGSGGSGQGFAGALPEHAPSGAGPTPTPTPTPAGPYVALGDSYTAGLKIAPQVGEPSGCSRSGANYPALVARGLDLAPGDFRDVSCTGARTGDLTGPQQTEGGANPAQLDALTQATRLVTLGIGGNDAGFTQVITECAKDNLVDAVKGLVGNGQADAPCRTHYSSGGTDQLQARVDAAGQQIGKALQEIRRRSPQARVYVVGYPTLLPGDPASCRPVLGSTIAAADLGFLAEKERELNGMLKQRAEAAGAVFVDVAGPSAGHDMCAGEDARWVEPPLPARGLAPVHPNAKGQEAVAAVVLKAVKG
ncbi:SGNH/GDSL hydrolase family protein [Kitasatospora sp. SUK 42]|uniref:SGNH/GDSL hydrolase family protein n=1 Tax=Kitasatospora sp. SUK 42 TaxID=1588882 RepID=UPI0018CBCD5A|nr:SGNH/GDSL hydrolase family protein [Kitasatospora sp. SUK 42]MBV2153876.1 SGNH/GDSL hydrolase family protein [Kitasatospora sp. SUK 42]